MCRSSAASSRALRSRPPKTPARLNRLVGYTERTAGASTVEAELATAEALPKRSRYRVERYGDSLSAERGYLRETGNLVFHMALVGVLATIGFAGGFGYDGQKVLIEGQAFVNVRGDYDSLNPAASSTRRSSTRTRCGSTPSRPSTASTRPRAPSSRST